MSKYSIKVYQHLVRLVDRVKSQEGLLTTLTDFVREWLPSGSGIDDSVVVDYNRFRPNRLYIHVAYHHMNEAGFYVGWSYHTIIARPTWDGIELRITGENYRDIKEYLDELFMDALTTDIKLEYRDGKRIAVRVDSSSAI